LQPNVSFPPFLLCHISLEIFLVSDSVLPAGFIFCFPDWRTARTLFSRPFNGFLVFPDPSTFLVGAGEGRAFLIGSSPPPGLDDIRITLNWLTSPLTRALLFSSAPDQALPLCGGPSTCKVLGYTLLRWLGTFQYETGCKVGGLLGFSAPLVFSFLRSLGWIEVFRSLMRPTVVGLQEDQV